MLSDNVEIVASLRYGNDHGLMIIEDPESTFAHADWDAAESPVSAGPDSLYLSVQPYVDGPVEIAIARKGYDNPQAPHVYFSGELNVRGRYLIVRDADDVMRYAIRCRSGLNKVRVMADEPGLASLLVIIVEND
ncbi:hypothetical protein [Kibdelosporangium aridum]|uniref:hypothetical protein n=1 Tax=Kibdelosporangium aridum TaxID=2030 RepID=UPI0035E8CAA5